MMSEWIEDSPKAPAVLISDGPHAGSSGGNGPGEHGIRVVRDHHHPHSPSAKRGGTEILVLGRLIGYPKLCTIGCEAGHNLSVRCIDTI